MRTLGICASLLAAAQIVAVSGPAYAQGGSDPKADTNAAADTKSDDAKKDDAKNDDAKKDDAKKDDKSAAPADGLVELHIDSPQQVSLEKRDAGATTWSFVCTSPCDARVSVGAEYRVTGSELNESKPFTIDGGKGKVTLAVVPGVHNKAQIGMWTLVGAAAVAVGGVLVLVLGGNPAADKYGQIDQSNYTALFVGSGMLLAGFGAGLFGASWLIDNAHTKVNGDVMRTTDEKGSVKADVKLSTSREKLPLPSFVGVPVWSGTF